MGKLIYAVVRADCDAFDPAVLPALEAVTHGDLKAIIAEVEGERLRASRANMKAHQLVQEALIARCDAVLPMRFGTIAADSEAVARLLEVGVTGFSAELERLAGKVEYTLRVIYPRDPLFAAARTRMGALPTDAGDLISVGQRVSDVLESMRAEIAARVIALLGENVSDVRQVTPADETIMLDAALLVAREREAALDAAIYAADAAFNGILTFRLVGALPVYSFVDIPME
jgi:hypothetical protein